MSRKTPKPRTIHAVNGIGPGARPSTKPIIEQRSHKAAQARKASVRRGERMDWRTLAAGEISDDDFAPHGRY